jgi:hypothetical protein
MSLAVMSWQLYTVSRSGSISPTQYVLVEGRVARYVLHHGDMPLCTILMMMMTRSHELWWDCYGMTCIIQYVASKGISHTQDGVIEGRVTGHVLCHGGHSNVHILISTTVRHGGWWVSLGMTCNCNIHAQKKDVTRSGRCRRRTSNTTCPLSWGTFHCAPS